MRWPTISLTPIRAPAADDLLSQMAGDEIDRLLAEAENDPIPPPVEQTAPFEPAPTPAAQTNAASDTAPAVVEPPAKPAAPDPVISSDDAGVSPPAIKIAANSVPAKLPAEPVQQPAVSIKKEAAPIVNISSLPSYAPSRDPFLVRILEMINSPLDHFDDGVRQTIGWIAIVTLFNAIAVLAYVDFMHRR